MWHLCTAGVTTYARHVGDEGGAARPPAGGPWDDRVRDDVLPYSVGAHPGRRDDGRGDDRPRAHRPGWLRLRLALGVVWAVVAVVVLLAVPREAAPEDLESALELGQVDRVVLVGGLGPDSQGWAVVEVRWRDGGFERRAELVEQRPSEDAEGSDTEGSDTEDLGPAGAGVDVQQVDGATAWVVEDVDAYLQSVAPRQVTVEREPVRDGVHLHGEPVPGWMAVAFVLLWLTSLVLLVEGPRPWRATRWAWFWLSPVPFGVLLFLLLSGPLPWRRWATEPVGRRLTGGWAFLLTLVLSSVLPAPFWW